MVNEKKNKTRNIYSQDIKYPKKKISRKQNVDDKMNHYNVWTLKWEGV